MAKKQVPEKPQIQPAEKKRQDTLLNGDAGVSTEPKSLLGQDADLKTLGRYQVLGELGRGGMGAVYLADDTKLKRQVALKIPQFEASKAEQMRARFEREAQMAAQLSHPNICQVYDVAEIDGRLVMSMEYIPGKTMAAYTKPGKLLSDRQAVTQIRKVALAVEAAHKKGMIHRDLKPGNIMLCRPDPTRKTIEPKVMDFGLAKSFEANATEFTKSGMIVGTPCYMSKEQWSARDVKLGPQCDVYSLGIILYELLTGKLPFDVHPEEPPTAWFVKLVTESPIKVSDRKPDIDAALEVIVMKAIAVEPVNRYASMAEFASALDEWSTQKPATAATAEQIVTGSSFSFSEIIPTPSVVSVKPRFLRKPPAVIPLWFKLAGGAATLLLLFSIVIWFRSGDALVKVEVYSDDVEVSFQNETMKLADGSHNYRVTPGDHVLHIKSGNVEFETEKFMLKKGQNPSVTVQIVDDDIVAKNGEEEVGRRRISLPDNSSTESSAVLSQTITNSIGMKLKLIPAGEFMMGSTAAEIEKTKKFDTSLWESYSKAEVPLHRVRISRPFYLGVYEVTKSQFATFIATSGYKTEAEFDGTGSYGWNAADSKLEGPLKKYTWQNTGFKYEDDHPVVNVSWNDSVAFCEWLSQKEGATYRLPTEAEWEYACRAGTTTLFQHGDDPEGLANVGNTADHSTMGVWNDGEKRDRIRASDGFVFSAPVGMYKANGFGIHDMHGNVWEWCSDWFRQDYYKSSPLSDPTGPVSGALRIQRGGSWYYPAGFIRSSARGMGKPTERYSLIGFRLAMDVPTSIEDSQVQAENEKR